MVAGMDLVESLRLFHAVAVERSFTRGAERCGQPQPVASRRVAALEERLGATLLVRTSRRVELSADGERLLPLAQELLARADRIDHLFERSEPGLVLAVPIGLSARSRAAIRRGLPDRSVTFAEDEPEARVAALSAGTAQLALRAVAPDEADIRVRLGVGHDDHGPAGRFFLEQLRRPVREREVPPRAVHVLAEDDVPAVRDRLREACYAAGLRADQVVVGTSADEAWTRVHERGDAVLAAAGEAEREGVAWSALGGLALVRGYRLDGDGELDAAERAALVSRVAGGLGGAVGTVGDRP